MLNNKRQFLISLSVLTAKLFLISIVLLSNGNLVKAQSGKIKFDKISLKHGLSQSSVFAILQDSKGFMWFATLDGLNKYDGYNITVYSHSLKDTNSISDNSINALFEDSDGTIWIGTRSMGLCIYNKIKDNFYSLKHDPNNKNSLSNNNIKDIYQDIDGNIWIGTEDGLNLISYDDIKTDISLTHAKQKSEEEAFDEFMNGKKKSDSRLQWKIQRYKHIEGDAKSLTNSTINKITGDNSGNLWIATEHGLNRYNPRKAKGVFTRFLTYKTSTYKTSKINTLFVSSDNYLFIGTEMGLHKLNLQEANMQRMNSNLEFTRYMHNPANVNSISSNQITSIIQDKANIIWIGTRNGGLNKYNPATETFMHYTNNPTDPNSISVDHVLCLYQDKTDIIWIGTSLGGINKWNRTVEGLQTYRHTPFDEVSLNASQIRTMYQDKVGDIWIGTVDGGLNLWDTITNTFVYYENIANDPNSISDNHIRSILEDSKGNFWLGTDGGGINLFDRKTDKCIHYKHDIDDPESISNDNVWKILEDRNGVLWVATNGGGLNIFNPETGKFKYFIHDATNPKSISDNHVTTIFEDHEGTLWIGTYGGGLNKWNKTDSSFIHYRHDKKDSLSIGNNRIYSIIEDSKHVLWIGAKGNLNKFDRKTETFKKFDESHGFPNNVIMGILEDKRNLWLSTNHGLTKFNKRAETIRNYDIGDGLQSNEFLVGAFYKTRNGQLLFGGINGFNAFYPGDIKDNPHKPEIVVTGFQIFNKEVELDTNITEKKILTLDYDQDVFSFDFVALNYMFPEKNQYRYRMMGFDKDWRSAGSRRFATYTNLPPGKYTFQVIGSNNDGVWNNDGVSIKVIITPPFWRTTWFIIVSILVIIASIYTYIKLRERKLQEDNRRLEQMVDQRTQEIEAQKKEIETQRDFANEQTKKIRDNILYASHIQKAIFPLEEKFEDNFAEHFIFYKPKDIVSGDYYWMATKGNKTFLALADCTGHGVSGAFMSVLGVAFLNAIMYKHIDERHATITASEILDELRETVKSSLHQTGKRKDEARDGMDIAFVIVDRKNMKVQFSGAYSPMYLLRGKEFYHLKADKMPIGIHFREKPFKNHEMDIEKDDAIYIFSDGYIDQFGGPKKRRFLTKQFKEVLVNIQDRPMSEQKIILDQTIRDWRGEYEQVDDILVIGIKISELPEPINIKEIPEFINIPELSEPIDAKKTVTE